MLAKKSTILVAILLIAGIAVVASAGGIKTKVEICHFKKDPNKAKTINVSPKSAVKHFDKHPGDIRGACGAIEQISSPEEALSIINLAVVPADIEGLMPQLKTLFKEHAINVAYDPNKSFNVYTQDWPNNNAALQENVNAAMMKGLPYLSFGSFVDNFHTNTLVQTLGNLSRFPIGEDVGEVIESYFTFLFKDLKSQYQAQSEETKLFVLGSYESAARNAGFRVFDDPATLLKNTMDKASDIKVPIDPILEPVEPTPPLDVILN
ncbi:hypothetical protein COB64_04480 [Candidatus Wolfebacteria bacterium]|nr:MAG: hypothetical protein COB64_04480 [Candidatus Wolfebacteria bacterium]